jgi:hypothetical protein
MFELYQTVSYVVGCTVLFSVTCKCTRAVGFYPRACPIMVDACCSSSKCIHNTFACFMFVVYYLSGCFVCFVCQYYVVINYVPVLSVPNVVVVVGFYNRVQ